eukprot:jgi/Orpsp1_1/1175119/evm.model.c7180000052687.1
MIINDFLNDKNNLEKEIDSTIEWVINNQDESIEKYENKKLELEKLEKSLKLKINEIDDMIEKFEKFENEYKMKKERIESMNNLKEYAYELRNYLKDESILIKINYYNNFENYINSYNDDSIIDQFKNDQNENIDIFDQFKNDQNENIDILVSIHNFIENKDNLENKIDSTIEWIKNNQNESKEKYDNKKLKLEKLEKSLKLKINEIDDMIERFGKFENEYKQRIESMNTLKRYAYELRNYLKDESVIKKINYYNNFENYINSYNDDSIIDQFKNDQNENIDILVTIHNFIENKDNLENKIDSTIEWVKNNQNESKEKYENKKIKLEKLEESLILETNIIDDMIEKFGKFENEYKMKKEIIESMNTLKRYAYELRNYLKDE